MDNVGVLHIFTKLEKRIQNYWWNELINFHLLLLILLGGTRVLLYNILLSTRKLACDWFIYSFILFYLMTLFCCAFVLFNFVYNSQDLGSNSWMLKKKKILQKFWKIRGPQKKVLHLFGFPKIVNLRKWRANEKNKKKQ